MHFCLEKLSKYFAVAILFALTYLFLETEVAGSLGFCCRYSISSVMISTKIKDLSAHPLSYSQKYQSL